MSSPACPPDCPDAVACCYCTDPACPEHQPDDTVTGCADGTSHHACHAAYCRDRDCFDDPDDAIDAWRDALADLANAR